MLMKTATSNYKRITTEIHSVLFKHIKIEPYGQLIRKEEPVGLFM